jgi:uncharacterized membrane protein YedE/YeeE
LIADLWATTYGVSTMGPDFTPILSLFGGILIGLATVLLLLSQGRLAGISGIVAKSIDGSRTTPRRERWRWAFLAGLVSVGVAAFALAPATFEAGIQRSMPALAVGGWLVGYGTQLGGGCTSGHGVCGNSRLSPRSLVATVVFMATGVITVALVNQFTGGAL